MAAPVAEYRLDVCHESPPVSRLQAGTSWLDAAPESPRPLPRDDVALRMVSDDRDPEQEHVGRDGADRDDDTARGELSRGVT
jgi:hypothetical protein